ncbi:tape measure protein [Ensifer psoraleae]|uniref:Tape measure protein n=1 Tax=Sinorhizobium psoraleae TaxID=520838 RepID=A0ABT4KIA5_9HYPH|nr:tape measure protein [Sinorhizobium psoraleae]MCZ4091687.1 tape measure protein [Sinorhizobium psoraleae]
MATDLERLTVQLQANISQFERQMQRARQTMDKQARAIEGRWTKTNRNLSKFSSVGLARAGGAIGGALVAGFSLQKAQQLIDSATRITNALKVAGLQGEELERVYGRLFEVAQRQAVPIEGLVDLYGKLSLVQKELGVNSNDLIKFTDNVAAALKVAGTDATAARGALTQLAQALGGGTVRAEEFNSVLEGRRPSPLLSPEA